MSVSIIMSCMSTIVLGACLLLIDVGELLEIHICKNFIMCYTQTITTDSIIMAITRSKQKLENQKRKEADDALGYDGVYHHYLFKLQEILNIQFFQKLNSVLLLRSFFRFEWLNTLVVAPLLAIFKYCMPFLFVDPQRRK